EPRLRAARILVARERAGRAADGQRVRSPRVDAHRPGVARLVAGPQIAPGPAAVLRAEEPGDALAHGLRIVLEAAEAGGGVEHVGPPGMANQHVDVGIVTRRHAAPAGAGILGRDHAADLDADPPAVGIHGIDRQRAGARTGRIVGHAPALGSLHPRQRLDLRPGLAAVAAAVERGRLRAGVNGVRVLRIDGQLPDDLARRAAEPPR